MPVVANSKTIVPKATPPPSSVRLTRFDFTRPFPFPRFGSAKQTDARAEPARPEVGTASGASNGDGETLAEAWMLERFGIHDVAGDAAGRDRQHALARAAAALQERLVRDANRVRREDDVVEREQRVVAGERLLLEHVERRSRQPPLAQGRRQRPLVDDRPARDVDQ